MKGGHARSGPAPDPDALRRDRPSDESGWVTLPADGREGEAPDWPLPEQSDREAELWAREWLRPQAVMWERNGQEHEVALYVRAYVAAEATGAPTNARTLVRQFMEGLGISVPGLLRNRWKIAAARSAAEPRKASSSARDRFTVLPGGEA